jgi:hypothetical protein
MSQVLLRKLIEEPSILYLLGDFRKLLWVQAVSRTVLDAYEQQNGFNRKLDTLLRRLYALGELHIRIDVTLSRLKLVSSLFDPAFSHLAFALVHGMCPGRLD